MGLGLANAGVCGRWAPLVGFCAPGFVVVFGALVDAALLGALALAVGIAPNADKFALSGRVSCYARHGRLPAPRPRPHLATK